MKIAFNPSNSSKNILDLIKNNKDIIFDLKGHSIYARGVEFKGTDTNTWRPVVDNLTSNSATSSLSANQGRVLAGLINGKSDSDHNHDGRYVKKSGDTMFGVLTIDTTNFGALTIKRNDDANGASIQFRGKSNIYGYIGLNNSTKDKQFLRWNSDTSRIYTILDTSSTYTANGKGVINGTTITQVDNATNSTNSTNARKLVNWYSARPTSLNAQFGDGSLRIFYATSSTTVGKCPDDATVLHLAWDNNGGQDTQLALAPEENKMYFRGQNKSTWQSWKTLAFTTDIPSSLKNPYSFNVFGVIYDGSAAKVVGPSNFISQVTEGTSTITDGTMLITSYASNSGFADTNAVNVPYKRKAIHLWEYIKAKTDSLYATKSHNHDGRYVYNYGGTAANGQTLNQNALFMSTTSGISGDWWHILQAAWNGEYRWNSQIAFPTQNRNGMYYRSGLDDNTKWGSWVKLLDANNYSSTLDSRYYTETEVNTLLDAKLNRQNLSYGTWNPRGYHLAADYNYNGGDLSISESGGQIHVSVDGYFWQNEGQYRVLDTSDVAGLKGGLTVHQYLSNTDTTWWPLIWGGSSHNNTSDSTGAVYKSHDVLSWQTSSQTLYATHLRTTYIDLENSRGISQVTSGGTSPYKGIRLPNLQSNGIGMFSKIGSGEGANEGGIIISADTSVIYNSFDTGWGLTVRDKDRGQTNISGDGTIAFGVRQDYRAYSLGGFEKSGSDNTYVLLGGGGHKLESSLNVANANTISGYDINHLLVKRGRLGDYNIDHETTFGTRDIQPSSEITISGKKPFDGWGTLLVIGSIDGASNQQLAFTGNNRMYIRCAYGTSNNYNTKDWATVALTSDNVASATNAYHLRINSVNTWSTWYWAGQGGQPSWLWGSNDGTNMYVWNPSNFRVAYASSAGNADTVDGEHASNFVRAGNFESANLNSLDTYSFIKSVNSTVASASPGGYTGWYNVIQAVHRNGSGNGPGYIGQIALGMTTNIGGMFYRTKYNGSWYAWHEVVTTNTGLLRYSRNNVNISSPNCSPIPPSLLEWTIGYPRLYDPEFNEGYNYVGVYNNTGNGVVTVTRVHDTNVGNSSSYIMKVVSAAGASPNYGGWHVATQTELGKVYTCLFRARIPSGVEIEWNSNSIGTGGQMSWLTNNMGTDKWTWYAVQVYCGSGGSTTFYFSAKSPCTWYLSYVNVIENNRASYAGLRSVYSDYLKANASIVFGRNELQYFNQNTGVTAGATNNANPKTNWYHILRMNHANNSGYFVDLAIPFFDNRIQFRRITSGSDNGWRRVITEEPNHDVILCEASTGGNVGIGINNPAYKLDVNGQMRAGGFHHWTVNSDNYMLLAGGGYKSFGGDNSNPVFLGYLDLDHGNDGTISSSFSCLGYSVPFTYTRGGNYCKIYIPDTTHQTFYIKAATASVHYSGGGMDAWTGVHGGSGAWWLHCYAQNFNEVRVKGFCQNNRNYDSWWGGNPLWSGNDGANRITVCIFGYVKFDNNY